MADTPIQKATLGRIVHYVHGPSGEHHAALITKVVPDKGVSLTIFGDGFMFFAEGILHDADFGFDTWHWPERD